MDPGMCKQTLGTGGDGMSPFKRITIVLMLNVLSALCLMVCGAAAALPPTANYLGRIAGVIAPVRLAIDSLGKLYVADPRNSGIMQYDSAGHLIKKFPIKATRGVAVTPFGDLVVTQGNTALVINTDTGSIRFPFGQFKQASGVAVDDAGQIYIVDTLDSVVQVFSASGQPLPVKNSVAGMPSNSFGAVGSSGGQLSLPTAIAFDRVSKQLVVSDTGNSRLVIFDPNGGFIRTIGGRTQNGTAPVFTSPQSVSLEYSKTSPQILQRIYVTDSYQSEVQIIDPLAAGTYLGSIGGYGSTPGKLKVPVDTLFDASTSRLLITNGAGDITIYGINVTSSLVPDTSPPTLTLDPLPGVTVTNAVVIGGTVEREAQLQITVPAGVVVGAISTFPAPDAALYFWQAAVSGLVPGANLLTVTARDSAITPTTKTATITYDPTSVRVSINPFTLPVNNSTQLLSGTADQGAGVTLSGISGVTFDPVVTSGTTWQSKVSGLSEGVNTITATAVANGKSSSVTTRITLITSKPPLEISALPDGSKTFESVANISGVLPLGGYFGSLTVNGVAVNVTNNAFSTALQLIPGPNPIAVMAQDTAGNTAQISRTIILDELLPTVAITEPSDGSYINGTDINLKGSVKPGNTVRLLLYNGSANGVAFTQINQAADSSKGLWSTAGAIPLDPGLNTIVAEVTDKVGNSSKIKITITRDASIPALGVTSPIRDVSVNRASQSVTGTVASGTAISATLNDIQVPVTLGAGGTTYSIPVNLSEEKQYSLAITASDAMGNSATAYRNLVYDVTAPQILPVDPANPLKVTFKEGVPEVLDKNGPVAGVTITVNQDGSKTVDVSKAVGYDPKTLDIHAVDAAGNSTRNGNVTGIGKVEIKDAFKLLRLSASLDTPTAEHMLRGDVAPVVNGVSRPDGVLDVFDVVYVLEKIVGLR